MNNRLRSSFRKTNELQTKHIKKFKFRGTESNGGVLFSEGFTRRNVNNSADNKFLSSKRQSSNRKRKMVSRVDYSRSSSKAPKMDLAEEIQLQIDDQIRMREGAMKLMSASSTLNQALETSKNLLTINARILGLMSALQKKKQERVLQEYNRQRSSSVTESPQDACTGRIAISDMRIPLMWRDNVHFTGKTGDQSYYAFALIRCGDQVRDTPLYEITSADTDMYFDLAIPFDDLPPDFKMDFEVYYTVLTSNEAHGMKAPRSSMNLRNQKKQIQFKAPKFCLAGHVHIGVDDIRSGIISKDLTMGGKGASGVAVLGDLHEFPVHPLELWGQICFQLAAQPVDMKSDIHKGPISIELNSPANKYYCILRQDMLHCWENEEHVITSQPLNSIKLTANTKVSQVQSAEVNSVKLLVGETVTATLIFDSSTDCFEWKNAIRRQINNILSWKYAFEEQMYIAEMKKNRLSIPSTASFYDQIKIEEITSIHQSSHAVFNGKGIINEAFNNPPPSTQTIEQKTPSPSLTNGTNHQPSNDENKENWKQSSCDKKLDNNSETVPSSSTTEPPPTEEGQDPAPQGLLLQNGHPPPSTHQDPSTQQDNEKQVTSDSQVSADEQSMETNVECDDRNDQASPMEIEEVDEDKTEEKTCLDEVSETKTGEESNIVEVEESEPPSDVIEDVKEDTENVKTAEPPADQEISEMPNQDASSENTIEEKAIVVEEKAIVFGEDEEAEKSNTENEIDIEAEQPATDNDDVVVETETNVECEEVKPEEKTIENEVDESTNDSTDPDVRQESENSINESIEEKNKKEQEKSEESLNDNVEVKSDLDDTSETFQNGGENDVSVQNGCQNNETVDSAIADPPQEGNKVQQKEKNGKELETVKQTPSEEGKTEEQVTAELSNVEPENQSTC
ncbi:rhotekin-2-like isoform X1 [Clytia hemisphaerica]|uniref:PH domain-containing protein n=1 Tax=Clytia hemisphaerica TaxID=252671 RepID=A0A7M6DQ96_9CNID